MKNPPTRRRTLLADVRPGLLAARVAGAGCDSAAASAPPAACHTCSRSKPCHLPNPVQHACGGGGGDGGLPRHLAPAASRCHRAVLLLLLLPPAQGLGIAPPAATTKYQVATAAVRRHGSRGHFNAVLCTLSACRNSTSHNAAEQSSVARQAHCSFAAAPYHITTSCACSKPSRVVSYSRAQLAARRAGSHPAQSPHCEADHTHPQPAAAAAAQQQ